VDRRADRGGRRRKFYADPLTLGGVVMALAASLMPAWRAARVNPLIVLRG
jgi:ABC-type antimicrobial peptide transport system permease subunit